MNPNKSERNIEMWHLDLLEAIWERNMLYMNPHPRLCFHALLQRNFGNAQDQLVLHCRPSRIGELMDRLMGLDVLFPSGIYAMGSCYAA